jgi:hypothetical protein
LLFFATAPLRAQEPPENELELVRQLRIKGWTDLAKSRIEELLKGNNPVLSATLPLELARVNVAIARHKDPEQRFSLFKDARGQLQGYIDKNKGKPEAALASVELARLTSYHAEALLTKAMREEDAPSRQTAAKPARDMFEQAGRDLEAAIKNMAAVEPGVADPQLKKLLTNELQQAKFDVAVNLFDQARTHIDKSKEAVNTQRTATVEKARKAFVDFKGDDSAETAWLAVAWLMKCAMEQTDPPSVLKYFDQIMKKKDAKEVGTAIVPAVRLATYFHMQDLTTRVDETETIGRSYVASERKQKLTPVQRLKEVQKLGEAWLKAYPGHLRSYEGQGVLFELGCAYMLEAMGEKDQKVAGPNYDKAIKHLDELAALDGDLAERGRQFSMSIKFKRLDTKAELRTFDEYMMKAMVERRNVIELSQKLEEPKLADRKALEADRRKHLKEVITSLNKAMALATPQTPIQKVDDARYYLTGAYLTYGDAYRAAIVAESLGRAKPPTRRSPEGAATALATYAALQNRHPGDTAIKQRLLDLADFVLSPENARNWGADPVTSMANYHLGLAARSDNPKKAIGHLEKVAPDFTDYIYIQGQLAFIAEAARAETEVKADQVFYRNAAKAAIGRMPKLNPKNESSSVIAMYFFAKVELSKYMYTEAMEDLQAPDGELKAIKKCNEMAAYVKGLLAEFEQVPAHAALTDGSDDFIPNGRISKKNREQLQFTMFVMLKYADLGIAEVKFRGDTKERFAEVIKATEKVVNETLGKAKSTPGTEQIRMQDYRVTGDILGLALRAHVQQGNVEKGKEILDVLKRLGPPKDQPQAGGSNVVAALLNDIAGQIRKMTKDNDKSLVTTKGHYSAFLDEIAKEYDAKGYDNNAALMIAHAFSSLDYPAKAAAVFAKVTPPKDLDKKVEKGPKEDVDEFAKRLQLWTEDTNRYWAVQIEYIRALRATKDKESAKTAESTIEKVLKHPLANYKVQAMIEKNLILEDQQKFRDAYAAWQGFMKQDVLVRNLANKDVQKVYFTGYFYSVRTLYKTATLDPGIKDRPKLIVAAAGMIVKLEYAKTKDGWNVAEPLFEELFKDKESEQLKKEYDKQKAAKEKELKTSMRDAPAARGLALAEYSQWRIPAGAKPQAAIVGRKEI